MQVNEEEGKEENNDNIYDNEDDDGVDGDLEKEENADCWLKSSSADKTHVLFVNDREENGGNNDE